jgi:HPt (histidine-containing phosphotransfer) domain-containing protein
MDYSVYLPDIDVEDGKARVMGNLKLYMRLLGKFDGAKLSGAIVEAIEAGDMRGVSQAAHALRGTSANLGFPVVKNVTEEIENRSKAEQDCSEYVDELKMAADSLAAAIGRFLEEQS